MEKKTRYLKISTVNNWEYFLRSSGSNNRKWVARYQAMMDTYETLRNTSGVTEDFLSGYKQCLEIFHKKDNILVDQRH